jgi:hypothetical protein
MLAFQGRVDVLVLLETIGSIKEATFYLKTIRDLSSLSGTPVWISFCLKLKYGVNQHPACPRGAFEIPTTPLGCLSQCIFHPTPRRCESHPSECKFQYYPSSHVIGGPGMDYTMGYYSGRLLGSESRAYSSHVSELQKSQGIKLTRGAGVATVDTWQGSNIKYMLHNFITTYYSLLSFISVLAVCCTCTVRVAL